jgi:T4 RnlA family RNA ligase
MKTLQLFHEAGYDAAVEYLTSLGIKVKDYGNLVLLNYDQIESPKTNEYVMECRSFIIDKRTFDVVSRSFDRFFNYGEAEDITNKFDWNHAMVFEKADGSLIKVYKYNGKWEISTRGSAFAEVDHTMGGTFRDKVLEAFGTTEENFQFIFNDVHSGEEPEVTYIFEYTGPENRIVTRYDQSEMVLLAIRDHDGDYAPHECVERIANAMRQFRGLNVRAVDSFSTNNIDKLVQMAKELPALDEGYVAWDYKNNIRIKIKNPSYVAIHKLRDNGCLSPKRIAALVLENDHEEYLSYFPEDRKFFEPFAQTLFGLRVQIGVTYNLVKNIESQRDFALAIKDCDFSSVLFTARKLGLDPIAVFNTEAKESFKIDLLIKCTKSLYGENMFSEAKIPEGVL